MKSPIITATNLSKHVHMGERSLAILTDINLHIDAGEFVSIMGKSGSGKSTLLGLLAGLDQPTHGSVRFADQDLGALDEEALAKMRQQQMGFVFQSFHLLPTLTVTENIAFVLDLAGKPDPSRVDDLIAAVGLSHRKESLPAQLSGGEQQRCAIARALIARPQVIFADEPTGNLDAQNAADVMALLLDLQHRFGTALVVVTHDDAVAAQGGRTLTLVDGALACNP